MNILSDAPVALLIVIAVLGITLAAFLSAAEAALLNAPKQLPADSKKLDRLNLLLENRSRSISAVAFVRIVAEMVATACITVSFAKALDEWWAVVLLATLVATIVAVLLVRLSPRSVARANPLKALEFLSLPALVSLRLFGWVGAITLGEKLAKPDSEEELRRVVEQVNESEVIEEDDREMIESIVTLGQTTAKEIMVPRPDMVTIRPEVSVEKSVNLFVRSGYSRIPVVGDDVDNVLGVLFFKDVMRALNQVGNSSAAISSELMRPVSFVPETKPVDDLLRELQVAASHIVILVDEYGGVAGMVTIEDVLEEIVGELRDEHDQQEIEVQELPTGGYRVPARLSIPELAELFEIDIAEDEVETVAGLLAKALGKVPVVGAAVKVHGLELRADRVEGRRKKLATVLVAQLPEPESVEGALESKEEE